MPSTTSGRNGKGLELSERLLDAQSEVEHSFKRVIVRESVFKRDKLSICDKRLHAERTIAAADKAMGSPSRRGKLSHGAESPSSNSMLNRSFSSSWSSFSGQEDERDPYDEWRPPGAVCGRLGASTTMSRHPVIHPGVTSSRPSSTIGRPSSSRRQPPLPEGLNLSKSASAGFFSPASTRMSTSMQSSDGKFISLSQDKRMTSAREDLDRLLSKAPSRGMMPEEDLMHEMDTLCAQHELAGASGELHPRPNDRREMIDRLGDLMSLLGPRYRTVNKEMIWKRAEHGESTAFMRRLMKSREIGAISTNPLSEVLRREPGAALEVIGPDPDGPARASWLRARRKNRNENVSLEAALEGIGGSGFLNLNVKE